MSQIIIADGPNGATQIDMTTLTDDELLEWSASGSEDATHLYVLRAAGQPWQRRAAERMRPR